MAKPLDPNDPTWHITPEDLANLPNLSGEKGVLFTSTGLAVTKDGKLKKSKYLNVLAGTIDDYSAMVFTKKEVDRLRTTAYNLRNGSTAAMPVVCTGPLCPWATRCVYMEIGKPPIGMQCLVEIGLMKQWQLSYLEEYEIDTENFTEMTLINELVEVELSLYRCNLSMSLDIEQASGIVDVNIGVDHHGNPITQKQISQSMELREKLLGRKHRLIKMLVGDRQEKYKKEAALKTREARDPSSTMAGLKEQMESLQRELGKATEKLLEPIAGKVISQNEQKVEISGAKPLSPDDLPEE